MKKALLAFMVVIVLAFVMPYRAEAVEQVYPEGKAWEYGASILYKDLQNGVKDTVSVGLRMQRRVVYPLLLGVGVEGAEIGDVLYGEVNVPVTVRTTIGDVKADLIGRPGVAYAKNSKTDVSKFMGVGTVGLEFKYFVIKGVSVGVGVYYSITTYSKMNNLSAGLVISF